VQISTLGPFVYVVGADSDHARFEMKPAAPGETPSLVKVVRPQTRAGGVTFYDRLEGDVLELQIAHKSADKRTATQPKAPQDGSSGNSRDWVHAWGRYIVLTSDEEKLQVHGNDLVYDARTKQTTIKGSPETVAIKEGNDIHAPELIMQSGDEHTDQQATAKGAGYFRVRISPENRGVEAPGAPGATRELTARWSDQLIYIKKKDGQQELTLTGGAYVEDREHMQLLQGDQVKLLLVPEAPGKPLPESATRESRSRPRRLEATGRVTARSPELHIHDTEQLILLFKDPAPEAAVAPNVQGSAAGASPGAAVPSPAAANQNASA